MKLLTLLALIVSGAAFVFAQERPIDKAEFEAAVNGTDAHKIKWAGQSYRINVTSSVRRLDRPDSDYSAESLIEFGPAPNVRTLLTSTYGGKTTSSERLVLGDSLYTRENGGLWNVATKKAAAADDFKAANTDSVPPTIVSSDIAYFAIGKERLRGEMATVFRKVETTREVDVSTGDESESVLTFHYWIVDGLQRRHQLRSQRRSTKYASTNVITMEWNLDPSIKFTAPPIGAGKQDPPR